MRNGQNCDLRGKVYRAYCFDSGLATPFVWQTCEYEPLQDAANAEGYVNQVDLVWVHTCKVHFLHPILQVVGILSILAVLEPWLAYIFTDKFSRASFELTSDLALIFLALSEEAKSISEVHS